MSASLPQTSHELLVRQAERFGGAPAIVVADRAPLDYAALLAEVERTAAALAGAGIGRRSRVAVALPECAGSGDRDPGCPLRRHLRSAQPGLGAGPE